MYLVTAEYRLWLRSLLSDCFDYKVTGGYACLAVNTIVGAYKVHKKVKLEKSLQSTQKSKTKEIN